MVVRLRPNAPHLTIMAVAVGALAWGIAHGGLLGLAVDVAAGLVLVLFGYPALLSTVFRVPVMVIADDGVRLPLMGVHLPWNNVSSTGLAAVQRRPGSFALVIVPVDADDVVRQARPWLRREARNNIGRHGSPIVVSDASLDRSIDDIAAGIAAGVARHRRP
jgi:hypothetical protein